DRYRERFTLSSDISTRDRDGVNKTFSGLMKILFPEGNASAEEMEMLLRFAVEGRKRVKDQLLRIDSTYGSVRFCYTDTTGKTKTVTTLEEEEYPHYYHKTVAEGDDEVGRGAVQEQVKVPASPEAPLQEKHLTFQENQKGVSYDALLGPYLEGATKITVTDPYIRLFYQVRNFMEFLETIVRRKAREDEIEVHLITVEDEFKADSQHESFEKIQEASVALGVAFTWEFDGSGTLHARHITTDHGWKISLDRGLDIFQHYEMNNAFSFANRLQAFRSCKAFEATFIRVD
ncbi:MAG TPA: MIT C-terminal domain-containing protein, partial [Synergistales bacterium]|nr:MIT C-terminal domain-containing protein [Synergistales bacterium]